MGGATRRICARAAPVKVSRMGRKRLTAKVRPTATSRMAFLDGAPPVSRQLEHRRYTPGLLPEGSSARWPLRKDQRARPPRRCLGHRGSDNGTIAANEDRARSHSQTAGRCPKPDSDFNPRPRALDCSAVRPLPARERDLKTTIAAKR